MFNYRNSGAGESARKCPTCRDPLGDTIIRNRALENIIACSTVQCPFAFNHAQCQTRPCRKDLDKHMQIAQAEHHSMLDAMIDAHQAEAILPLVALLSEGRACGVKVAAVQALSHLIRDNDSNYNTKYRNIDVLMQAGAIPHLILMLTGSNHEALAAARLLQHMVDHCHLAITGAGAIPHLVRLLRRSNHHAHAAEDARMVTTVAAEVLEHLTEFGTYNIAIAEAGAITVLVSLLGEESTNELGVQATRVLANISMCPAYRSAIMELCPAPLLVPLLCCHQQNQQAVGIGVDDEADKGGPAFVAARLLNNLALCAEHTQHIITGAGALPELVKLLRNSGNDAMAAMAAASALDALTSHGSEVTNMAVADAGAIPALVAMLRGESMESATPRVATRALLNIATCNSHHRTCHRLAIVREGAIHPLVVLLGAGQHYDTRAQATWLLVCLSVRTRYRMEIANSGALPHLVAFLQSCTTYGNGDSKATEGALAATRALHNLSICSENADAIVRAGALTPLIQLIAWWQNEATPDANTAALVAVRVLQNLAICAPKTYAIISSGALPPLVTMLSWGLGADNAKVAAQAALEATRALQNISFWAGAEIIKQDALSPLLVLMSSWNPHRTPAANEAALTAARVAQNLTMSARDGDAVIRAGALAHIVKLLDWSANGGTDDAMTMALVAARVLQNLAFTKYHIALIEAGAVIPLMALIYDTSGEAIKPVADVAATVLEELADAIRDSANGARRFATPSEPAQEQVGAGSRNNVRLILRKPTTGSVLHHVCIAERSRKHISMPI